MLCSLRTVLVFTAASLVAISSNRSQPVVNDLAPRSGPPDASQQLRISGSGFGDGLRVGLIAGGPTLIGRSELQVDTFDVALHGDLALVAVYEHVHKIGGLKLVDISDPRAPVVVGSFDTLDMGLTVAVSDGLAYVATLNAYTWDTALRVVDVSNPTAPRELGVVYAQGGNPSNLVIDGGRGYLAAGPAGVMIFDLADAKNPKRIATIPSADSNTYGVAVSGKTVYMADGIAGLRAVDITNLQEPRELGRIAVPQVAYDVVLNGATAFVSDPGSSVLAIDVRDPAQMKVLGSTATPGTPTLVTLVGKQLFIADGPGGLTVVDVANPALPRVASNVAPASSAQALSVVVRDGIAYLADFYVGLMTADVRHPVAPQPLVGNLRWETEGRDAQLEQGKLYVAAGEKGLLVVDAANEAAPEQIGSLEVGGTAEGVFVANHHAYVAAGFAGLVVVDVTDPTEPKQLGAFDTPGQALSVVVEGTTAFVADDQRGLRLIDVTDPTAPRAIGAYDTPGRATAVTVAGGYAYVADYLRGVQVIDLSDPTRPTLVANHDTVGRAVGVSLLGNTLFVADDFGGVAIVDVTVPRAPQLIASLELPASALDLQLRGGRLLVAANTAGLVEIDIADLRHPFLVGVYETPGAARSIAGGSSTLWVADGVAGVSAVRTNPPLTLPEVRDDQAITVTVPPGFIGGPYHVSVIDSLGTQGRLENGYSVCQARPIAARLVPAIDPLRPGVVLPLPWSLIVDAEEGSDAPAVAARFSLPTLPAAIAETQVTKNGPPTIDLTLSADGVTARVQFASANPAALRAAWSSWRTEGGIPLSAGDKAGSFQSITIGYASPSAGGAVPLDRADRIGQPGRDTRVYRFVFDGERLMSIFVTPTVNDLTFALESGDAYGCSNRQNVSFRDGLAAACDRLSGGQPALAVLCGEWLGGAAPVVHAPVPAAPPVTPRTGPRLKF